MVTRKGLVMVVSVVLTQTLATFCILHLLPGEYRIEHRENSLVGLREVVQSDIKQKLEKERNNSSCVNDFNKTSIKQSMNLKYGPGVDGVGVKLGDADLKYKREGDNKYRFNTFISDSIGIYRTIRDLRPHACKERTNRKDLPPVSVVITYRDEWPSVVLRTAYSVLQMSPPELIQEIIFVDDGSTDKDLIAQLDFHVANVDTFKLIRNDVPLGLMKARMRGIDATKADYFIVMDGHIEVGPNWLEPLIEILLDKPNALLSPRVGGISTEDFNVGIGSFEVGFMFFDHLTLADLFTPYTKEFISARNHSVDSIPIGIIQGMITVMKKDFFYQLGGFDKGMEVWGFEQIELSVKVWMCGGTVEMVPCSVVAHLFRPRIMENQINIMEISWKYHGILLKKPPWGGYSYTRSHARNRARLASVWMDPPYQQYVMEPLKGVNYTIGDISDRVAIRRANKCKPYQYYIDKVQEMSNTYIPEFPKKFGLLYNVGFNKCLNFGLNKIGLYGCHGRHNQHFILTEYSEIRSIQSKVIKIVEKEDSIMIKDFLQPSITTGQESKWYYLDNNTLVNVKTGLCLTGLTEVSIGLEKCTNSTEQQWVWGYRDD